MRELVAPNAIKIKEKPTVKRTIGKILTFFSSSNSFKDFPETYDIYPVSYTHLTLPTTPRV